MLVLAIIGGLIDSGMYKSQNCLPTGPYRVVLFTGGADWLLPVVENRVFADWFDQLRAAAEA